MSNDKPDLVVWSEERGWYASRSPYGTDLSAPAFRPDDLTQWIADGEVRTRNYFQTQISELQQQYERLRDKWEWNERVYRAAYRFEPVVGSVYWLYDDGDGEFLSPIGPKEWRKTPIGGARLTTDRLWEKV